MKKKPVKDDAQLKLIDEAIERLDRHAESELNMARLFIERGKPEIARSRLSTLIEKYPRSEVVPEAKVLLRSLG